MSSPFFFPEVGKKILSALPSRRWLEITAQVWAKHFACRSVWSLLFASLLQRLIVSKLKHSTHDASTKLIQNPVATGTAGFEHFVFSSGTF